ncbi:MAG: MATE family efflux transporter [Candidatus Flemingiibacterium sp.]
MEKTRTNSFLESESIGRLMAKYSLPCIISLLVGALYNIVDQIFIANTDYLGSYGNSANTSVFPLTVIALAIATMIGDGCCAFSSISLGAGDRERAGKGTGGSVTVITISGIVLAAIYLAFSEPILMAFGANVNPETLAMAEEYFFTISLGIPFYMFGQALNPIIRSDGSPRFAMATLLAGALTNCVLDPIFIFPMKLGMTGAALATVIGQVISALLALFYLFRMKTVRLSRSSLIPDFRLMKRIFQLGMTSFLSQISIVFSMAAVLNVCRIYGARDPIFGQPEYSQIPTAVVGIVMKFFQIVISIAVGLSAGCIPISGYNVGAGRNDRIRELMKKLLAAEAVVGLAATIIFELFPEQIIGIFGASGESIHYTEFAVRCIRLYLCTLALSCVNKGTFIFLQSLGKALPSALLSLLREVGFGVGLVLLLPVWMGLDGVLWFMAIADVLTFAAVTAVDIKIYRGLKQPSEIAGKSKNY